MDPDDLRAFARRDWAALASAKRQYWAGRFHGEGGAPARHAATLLLQHARRLGVVGLTPDRRDDFVHHVEIRDRLDRAARAFSGC